MADRLANLGVFQGISVVFYEAPPQEISALREEIVVCYSSSSSLVLFFVFLWALSLLCITKKNALVLREDISSGN